MTKKNEKNILNLAGDLNEFLIEFISQAGMKLHKREEVNDIEALDYIFVSSSQDAGDASEEYNALKNEIKIICFEQNSSLKDFLLINGRGVLSLDLNDTPVDQYILKSMFKQEFSIHLDEKFPDDRFGDVHTFKITNHLNIGMSFDEMATTAFKHGHNIVPLRTFIDHSIYYFSYLKQSGLAGIPYEVEYANRGDFFVVNLTTSVKNFLAEYLIDAFGEVESSNPFNYLLGVSASACDFLEVTYLEDSSKLTLTGFFHKDNSNSLKGVSFNNIQTANQVEQTLDKKLAEFIPQDKKSQELNETQKNLQNKQLTGGIISAVKPPPLNSILSEHEDITAELVSFLKEEFQKKYPERDIKSFSLEDFKKISSNFENSDFVNKLTDEDKTYLTQRVSDSDLIDAYGEDLASARGDLFDDPDAINEIQSTMSNEIAEKIADKFDSSMINSILNNSTEKNDNIAVDVEPIPSTFGEFTSNIPDFSPVDAFDDISSEFATPMDFDATNVFDSISQELDMNLEGGEVETIEEKPDIFEESIPDFGSDGFDDLLPSNPDEFALAEFEDQLPVIPEGSDPFDPATAFSSDNFSSEDSITVKGSKDKPEESTLVAGSNEEADDFITKIAGLSQEEDDVFHVFANNSDEDDEKDFALFSSGIEEDRDKNMKSLIGSSLDKSDTFNLLGNNVKEFINKEGPEKFNAGLDTFAQSLGKSLEQFSEGDFKVFKDEHLPQILANLIVDEEKIIEFKKDLEEHFNGPKSLVSNNSFEASFKTKLEEKLADAQGLEKDGDMFLVKDDNLSEDQMKTLVKETVIEAIEQEFQFSNSSPTEIDAKEKLIIKSLSQTLGLPEDEVAVMVKAATKSAKDKEQQLVSEKIFKGNENDELSLGANTKVETELIKKIKSVEEENKKLKTHVSVMQLQLSTTDDVKEKFERIMDEVDEASTDIVKISEEQTIKKLQEIQTSINEDEKVTIVEGIKSSGNLSDDELQKVQSSLEKENQIIELAKQAEMAMKKAQIDAQKKDALFKTELEKAHKVIKTKDLVLTKAKESIKTVLGKKEKEMSGLRMQVNQLNQKLNDDQSVKLKQQVKSLNKAKETLTKTTELYKSKLEIATKNLDKKNTDENTVGVAEENRNLKRVKTQLENKINSEVKNKRSLDQRYQKVKDEQSKAKNEAVKAKSELKTTQGQLRILKEQNGKLVQRASSAGKVAAQKVQKELDLEKNKAIKLQAKIEELNKKLKDTPVIDVDPKAVESAQATKDVVSEKLSVKEINQLKGQNNQLQDKIKELIGKIKKVEKSQPSLSLEAGSAKELKLAESVKSMNVQLSKSRNEAATMKIDNVKFKKEVTGLNNKLTTLKKELERAKKMASATSGKNKKKAA